MLPLSTFGARAESSLRCITLRAYRLIRFRDQITLAWAFPSADLVEPLSG